MGLEPISCPNTPSAKPNPWHPRRSQPRMRRLGFCGLALICPLLMNGCSNDQPRVAATVESAGISGSVHGGQQPISGAQVQLYAVGTSGSGTAATPLISTPVITDSSGSFNLTGLYACPAQGPEVYLLATGGNPGLASGANNPQIAMMAAIGPCWNLTANTSVEINEVTTVAASYALAPYMQSYSAIGSNSGDAQGMADAFTMAAELANTETGSTPGIGVPTGQIVPSQKLNTLANILSSCVDSSGGTAGDSSPCGLLFSLASTGGTAPTDTVGALLNVARNPTSNVAPIFDLDPPTDAFQPSLFSAPADWTIEIVSPTPSPVLSPTPGTYAVSPAITLSDSDTSAAIYYTTDGSQPTSSSIRYTGAFVLSGTTTIRAVAIASGISSMLAAGTFTLQAATIALTPANITLGPSQTQAFTATVSGTSNAAVTWSLIPAVGSISAVGLYTAPAAVASPQMVEVTATSVADSTKVASATVYLVPPVSVVVTPDSASLTPSQTEAFTATVSGTANTAVTWSLSPAVGSISASGIYTAPAAMPRSATVTITAKSLSDPTKSASSQVTIAPPQAAGYSLEWEDTFSLLNYCTTSTSLCNWYGPGLWWFADDSGIVTDPSGTSVNLNWVRDQSNTESSTNISTISSNGAYYHAWTYGYFEVSMAFNPASGNWPAIWMLPVSMVNPQSPPISGGEIDIFEWFNNPTPTFWGTANVWVKGSIVANNAGANSWPVPTGTNFAAYNTYGVMWTPTAISWYFNNALMGTLNTSTAPFSGAFGGSNPYFLIISEQAGCDGVYFSTAPCLGQVSPLNMQVQWVHVYRSPAK